MPPLPSPRRDAIAQWAFDTWPILGRFHLWLEDVEFDWCRGRPAQGEFREMAFVNGRIERMLAMTAAVTALATRLFGRFGEGAGQDKAELNRVKKDADAISAYAMSECLWYLSRHLPENHAIMVCLGEGLMPKAGETPEMGANPQLGFGRVYARPEVARWLDERVSRLLNDPTYGWEGFQAELKRSAITVWGAAIDTLENTSRFALGHEAGPMTVLHLFNQPLRIVRPYEGYTGTLVLPRKVVEAAAEKSILIDFRTPRSIVLQAIQLAYPEVEPSRVHVWTLAGKSRQTRLSQLWKDWDNLGVHRVEDGWVLPSGLPAFTDSGTYAPVYRVGSWQDEQGQTHVFVCDGYAASAEALQAASLAPALDLEVSLAIFTSRFELPYERERHLMHLDPEAQDFSQRLSSLLGRAVDSPLAEQYARLIEEASGSGIPLHKATLSADDFFPERHWESLAVSGYMGPDPYTGSPGVEKVDENTYRVSLRLASQRAEKEVTLTLRLTDPGRKGFSPLLNRFLAGEDFENRPVKISDSGRIRNELQTLCAPALEHLSGQRLRLHFERIPETLIPPSRQIRLRQILEWYGSHHPLWFNWLEFNPSSSDLQD